MARKRISRRKFVGDVGAGVAFTIVPRHVLGRGYRAPSDKLNIACIGVGGMGANDVKGVGKTENIYALCDVDEHQAAQSLAAFPKAKRFKDFRVMLEKEAKNIDRPLEEYYTPPWIDWDLWLGPAPARPYHPAYAPFKWRGWWDFGTGALGDIACHAMDASFWALDLGYPTRIEPESTKLFGETAPACSRITYSFAAKGKRPEVKVVWRDGSLYPARPKEIAEPALWPFDTSGQLWIGDEGKLVAGIYGEDPRLLDGKRQAEITAHPPAQKYPRLESVYAEWIAACKGGTPAGSNFPDHAGPLTEMVLLGNLALRTAQVLEIDPHSGEVANTKVPAEYVRSEYRAGWTV